jgi:hypothetical protein
LSGAPRSEITAARAAVAPNAATSATATVVVSFAITAGALET